MVLGVVTLADEGVGGLYRVRNLSEAEDMF